MNNLLSESIQNRLSTQLLQQRGAQKKIVLQSGKLVNTFVGGSGSEQAPAPSSVLSSKGNLSIAEVSVERFYVVRSHFQKRGSSLLAAETMALLILDTAKALEVSPMSLLTESETNKLTLPISAYATLNKLRVPSDQQGVVETASHKRTRKGSAIRP